VRTTKLTADLGQRHSPSCPQELWAPRRRSSRSFFIRTLPHPRASGAAPGTLRAPGCGGVLCRCRKSALNSGSVCSCFLPSLTYCANSILWLKPECLRGWADPSTQGVTPSGPAGVHAKPKNKDIKNLYEQEAARAGGHRSRKPKFRK